MRIALLFVLAAALKLSAAVPPAAQLLPADTIALFSVPDWDKAAAFWAQSAQGRLWNDSALQPFRAKAAKKWTDEIAGPLERQSGIKLADYAQLLHGQVTLALTRNGWGSGRNASSGVLLLVDTKDREQALKVRLAELRQKWIDAGKPLRTDKIRNVEFTTFILSSGELSKALDKVFPNTKEQSDPGELEGEPEAKEAPQKIEVSVGQVDGLLIAGNSAAEIEKILGRQAGGLAPSLAEQGIYEESQSLFRDAVAMAWVDFAQVYERFAKQFSPLARSGAGDSLAVPATGKILAATGLNALKTIAARIGGSAEGTGAEVFLNVPEARRQGLFRLLAPLHKEAAPPAFAGADVVKFRRLRIDGQKAWKVLENTISSISPELAGLLQMGFQAAGKDRDPNFDLRQSFVGNLGDDFISLRKNPRSITERDLSAPPSLFLIGSANAGQLVQGINAATSLLPMAAGEPTVDEREFLGRKIYSLSLPSAPAADDPSRPSTPRTFNFAGSGGYAAMSSDAAVLEEYLRSAEAPRRALRDTPGLSEAAEKVGGMSTGFFGYENRSDIMRTWFESAKRETAGLDRLLSLAPLPGGNGGSSDDRKNVRQWFDLSVLPTFEQVSKYFHFVVYSLSTTEEGLRWKLFAPVPPGLAAAP